MGKSDGIKEKQKLDTEFRVFMEGLEQEAKKKELQILGDIDVTIQRHYKANNWDHARLFGDRNSDYQNYSDWSLDRIKNIINSIGNALQSGNFPSESVPGSDEAKEETVEEAKEFLPGFDSDYSLIIARVQSMISGVLTQFASSSSASQKTVLKDMPLSGGMHIFFGSTGSVYTNNSFFTNQFIGSFQLVYEVYMSVDEAKAVALKQILEATDIEIKMLNAMIISIREAQNTTLSQLLKDKKFEEYKETSDTFNEMRMNVAAERTKLVDEYNNYKGVADKVEQLLPHLNLTAFGKSGAKGGHLLEDFFSGKSLAIAKRYVREELALAEA